jgi:U3 small nucleolar RNA-associated protein 15
MYGSLIDRSPILESQLHDLRRNIRREIEKSKEAKRIEGMLELLLTR